MKRILSTFMAFSSFTLALLIVIHNPGKSQETYISQYEYVPNEVLVKFKKDVDKYFIQEAFNNLGGKIITYLGKEITPSQWDSKIQSFWSFLSDPNLFHIKVPEYIGTEQAIYYLSLNPFIEYAEKNVIFYPTAIYPNDQHFDKLWGLFNRSQTGGTTGADINAPSAWNVFKGSSNIIVAVIDSGVDYGHIDLAANIWINTDEIPSNEVDDDNNGYIDDVRGWDFYDHDNDPMDCLEHGTHVAGTIGAIGGNSEGVVGVNWNVKIMALKVGCTPTGGFSGSAIIQAIDYSTTNGANLSNNSYGGPGYSQSTYNAIERAKNAGKLFVAAAGNYQDGLLWYDNDQQPVYPASYSLDNIIAVLSTDHNDSLSSFSHYGRTSVDLGAPGGSGLPFDSNDIYSTKPNHGYEYLAGTSQAAPHVAGVAALVWGCRPDLTWSQVKNAIMSSTDYRSSLSGKCVAEGRLNAYRALTVYPPLWLTAPSNLQASPDCDSITLTWNDNSNNEQGFIIERKSGPYWSYLDEVGPNVTTYVDYGLPCGALFCYRVFAFNQNGNSLYSLQICKKTTPCIYCNGGLSLNVISDAATVNPGNRVTHTYTKEQRRTGFDYRPINR